MLAWRIFVAVAFGLVGVLGPMFDDNSSSQTVYMGCLLAAGILGLQLVIALVVALVRGALDGGR